MESTRAAMEAVLKSASVDNDSRWSGSPMGGDGEDPEEDNIEMHLLNGGHSPIEHSIHGYGRQLERPEPMEHMLTEDGEPMLNPGLFCRSCSSYEPHDHLCALLAELLTQVSFL